MPLPGAVTATPQGMTGAGICPAMGARPHSAAYYYSLSARAPSVEPSPPLLPAPHPPAPLPLLAGRPAEVEPFDPDFIPGMTGGFATVSTAVSAAASRQQQLAGAQQQQTLLARAAAIISSFRLAQSSSSGSSTVTDADLAPVPRFLQSSTGGSSSMFDPNWPTIYATVKYRDAGRRIPEGFLSTSHEWTRLADYGGANAAAWAEIFKVLSPSPVLRLGGATQDKLVDPPKDETWIALAKLQKLINARWVGVRVCGGVDGAHNSE